MNVNDVIKDLIETPDFNDLMLNLANCDFNPETDTGEVLRELTKRIIRDALEIGDDELVFANIRDYTNAAELLISITNDF